MEDSYPDNGRSVKFTLVRCDPTQVTVHIVDMLRELGRGGNLSAFSLRALSDETRPVVAVNAGSTESYSVPIATGLLKVRGMVFSPANRAAAADPGVLCIAQKHISVLRLADPNVGTCTDAVQRGPILLPGIRPAENNSAFYRTVAATDTAGRLLLVVTGDRSTLSGIYSFLFSSSTLGVKAALNMDGAASSGMLISPALNFAGNTVGNVDALVASAVAIYAAFP